MEGHQADSIVAALLAWIEVAALSLELLAVAIILVVAVGSTALFTRSLFARVRLPEAYERYKLQLGRGLLLGLEMLVAADVVRTVALEPTLNSVAVLSILVLVRTFLGWSLTVEIEHRWPWQRRAHSDGATAPHRDGL